MVEWFKTTDCKSVSNSFHWFKSNFSKFKETHSLMVKIIG
jgi:hypothetical protein